MSIRFKYHHGRLKILNIIVIKKLNFKGYDCYKINL